MMADVFGLKFLVFFLQIKTHTAGDVKHILGGLLLQCRNSFMQRVGMPTWIYDHPY